MNSTKEEIFAINAAGKLVETLKQQTDNIPAVGPYPEVRSVADAEELYGSGWSCVLAVMWHEKLQSHWLQLTLYHHPLPYRCDVLLSAGTRDDVIQKVHNPGLVLEIAHEIPILKQGLAEI